MDKLFSFSFESRTWTTKLCRKVLPSWTFGHAVRRKRSIFAFGSTQGEFGSIEVRPQSSHLPRHAPTIAMQHRALAAVL